MDPTPSMDPRRQNPGPKAVTLSLSPSSRADLRALRTLWRCSPSAAVSRALSMAMRAVVDAWPTHGDTLRYRTPDEVTRTLDRAADVLAPERDGPLAERIRLDEPPNRRDRGREPLSGRR